MFLICENLNPADDNHGRNQSLARDVRSEGTVLAEEFTHQAKLWTHRHPNRIEDDVAKILEVLADRDVHAHPGNLFRQ